MSLDYSLASNESQQIFSIDLRFAIESLDRARVRKLLTLRAFWRTVGASVERSARMNVYGWARGTICVERSVAGRVEWLALQDQSEYESWTGCFSILRWR